MFRDLFKKNLIALILLIFANNITHAASNQLIHCPSVADLQKYSNELDTGFKDKDEVYNAMSKMFIIGNLKAEFLISNINATSTQEAIEYAKKMVLNLNKRVIDLPIKFYFYGGYFRICEYDDNILLMVGKNVNNFSKLISKFKKFN